MSEKQEYRLHYDEQLGCQLVINVPDDIECVMIDAQNNKLIVQTEDRITPCDVYGGDLDLQDLRDEDSILISRFVQIELEEFLEAKGQAIAAGKPIPRAPWPISQRRVPLIIIREQDLAKLNKTTYRTYRAATG